MAEVVCIKEHKKACLVVSRDGCYVHCQSCGKKGPAVLNEDPAADGSPAQLAMKRFEEMH